MRKRLVLALFSFIALPAHGATLGTSASSPDPASSYSATSGLFSSTSGAVSLSSAGTEMMRVNASGVGIGTTSPAAPLNVVTNVANTGLFIDVYASNPNPTMIFRAAEGTPTSPSAVLSGDALASFGGRGYGATGFSSSTRAKIGFGAAENWTDTAQGAYITFNTTPIGTTASIRAALIDPSGNVGIGTSSPANLLDIGNGGGIHITSGTPSSTSSALYNNSGTLMWNGSAISSGSSYISSAGQLQCGGSNCANSTGSTTLQYCPYKGNVKTTAAQGDYTIPAACLTATLTSMYVGGVGSSSVAANTLYYIYLWDNSGTWVLDAETTGHATDSSTGIEIMSGDDTKTLVGMIHTNSSKKIMTSGQTHVSRDTNTVATWDNRIPTMTQCAFTASRQVNSGTLVEINSENRCLFMSWGDAAQLSSQLFAYAATGGQILILTEVTIDGTSSIISDAELGSNSVYPGPTDNILVIAPAAFAPTEGYHYTEILSMGGTGNVVTYPNGYTTVLTIQ